MEEYQEPYEMPKSSKTDESTIDISEKKFSTFSGADIKAFCPLMIGGKAENVSFLELQTITVSTHRQTQQVFGSGTFGALGFTRGHRVIAGSLVVYDYIEGGLEKIKKYHPRLAGITGRENILVDQIPPFNIIISYSNEFGVSKYSAIFGVTFISHGHIVSINDLATETTMQYLALDYQPLKNGTVLTAKAHEGISISNLLAEEASNSNIRNNPFLINNSQ